MAAPLKKIPGPTWLHELLTAGVWAASAIQIFGYTWTVMTGSFQEFPKVGSAGSGGGGIGHSVQDLQKSVMKQGYAMERAALPKGKTLPPSYALPSLDTTTSGGVGNVPAFMKWSSANGWTRDQQRQFLLGLGKQVAASGGPQIDLTASSGLKSVNATLKKLLGL